jgi:hypothetical protein
MSKNVYRSSVVSLLAVGGLLCVISLGGCPAPQTPTTPSSADDDTQPTQPEPTPDDELDRPIEPPVFDGDTTTSDDGDSTPTEPDSDGDGGGGDGGETEFVSISIDRPTDSLTVAVPPRVAQGAVITLQFDLTDAAGTVAKGELLVARDDDADRQPDGAPVYTRQLAILEGTNTWLFDTNTLVQQSLLDDGFGRFLLGARATTVTNDVTQAYSTGTITADGIAPDVTWVGAGRTQAELDREDHLVNRDISWTLGLQTDDNSPHTWRILLDPDLNPESGNEYELVAQTNAPAGADTRTPPDPITLSVYPADTYYYYVAVSDRVAPPVAGYALKTGGLSLNQSADFSRLAVTNRLIGEFDLDDLEEEPPTPAQSKGAIMQGFNFNDLSGSTLVSVPDLDGDGDSELVIGARFGKPNLNFFEGRGWGEAYLIYGDGNTRLTGQQTVNSVGASIPGLTFRGIRVPLCEGNYTEGLSDITVIDDMDGDELPELVFSFPRVESLNLGAPAWVGSNAFQHPELLTDENGMGLLEYDAINYMGGSWTTNQAQFTRGGIVIVSSHNELLTDPQQVTRKFDRVLDLHEVGQMFGFMVRPSLGKYIRAVFPNDPFTGCADCLPNIYDEEGNCTDGCGCDLTGDEEDPNETEYESWIVLWDTWLGGG